MTRSTIILLEVCPWFLCAVIAKAGTNGSAVRLTVIFVDPIVNFAAFEAARVSKLSKSNDTNENSNHFGFEGSQSGFNLTL